MPVLVESDPTTRTVVERCVLCCAGTGYWWAKGCSPLCRKCARKTTHAEMLKVSKDLLLGPLPTFDTNIPGWRPAAPPAVEMHVVLADGKMVLAAAHSEDAQHWMAEVKRVEISGAKFEVIKALVSYKRQDGQN